MKTVPPTMAADDSIESPASYVQSGFSDDGTFDCETPVREGLPRNCDQLSAGASCARAEDKPQRSTRQKLNRRTVPRVFSKRMSKPPARLLCRTAAD